MGDEHSPKGNEVDGTNHSLPSASDSQHNMASTAISLPDPLKAASPTLKDKDQLKEAVDPPPSQGFQPSFQQHAVCPVVYPPNTGCLLPLEFLKKLDSMSPSSFLSYIRRKLSTQEMESLMKDEKQRWKSFMANWPHNGTSNIVGKEMARQGFYNYGLPGQAKCVFCQKILCEWNRRDNPKSRHDQSCPFASNHECGNIKWKGGAIDLNDDNLSQLDKGYCTEDFELGIGTNRPEHREFFNQNARKKEFLRWSTEHSYAKENFYDTSFFYEGNGDVVRCFYCSCVIHGWRPGDDPWKRHAQYFPSCDYLLEQKGHHYVKTTNQEYLRVQRGARQIELEKLVKKMEKCKQVESPQEAMEELCLKLGHEREAIDEVMLLNDGVPYDKPRDMIEMLYKVEERQLPASDRMDIGSDVPPMSLVTQSQRRAVANEDLRNFLAGQDLEVPAATCHNCYRKTGQSVLATYIGLPCSHLIYCESCKADERKKYDNSASYRSKCPSSGCKTILSGLYKCYLS